MEKSVLNKCKTRGIQLACANCGIIYGFCELLGAESCTQVAQMYIDLCEAFNGMFCYYSQFNDLLSHIIQILRQHSQIYHL